MSAADVELLELAAKAGGLLVRRLHPDFPGGFDPDRVLVLVKEDRRGHQAGIVGFWAPLDDDGDARRLAVRVPAVNLHWVLMEAWQAHDNEEDRRAYVRRVIVLAAAEFAKAMP